ncbi:hypothetical protein FIBSPDRAFT_918682 [Athelia psychrophila]|uniref:GID complex catalytic subunit 2 n=1 Tax=Athelia psychrophila TaxID=1759441 RepID=A0A166NBL2_9AGAM|nr:hypothetical protein FIBSPDRAFT_918682 [Fibularhizoctonia sp. CBS 109695]
MDGPLKELVKLEKLTDNGSGKGKSASIGTSLDSLLQSLRDVKDRLEAGTETGDTFSQLSKTVETRKKEVDERQKEIYNSLSRFGKALDKTFTSSLPSYSPLFTSESSKTELERAVAIHLLRSGQFDTTNTFLEESELEISQDLKSCFIDMHRILTALRGYDMIPALEWVMRNRPFLKSRSSPLEFYLHRSRYIRMLLSSTPANQVSVISYANAMLRPFHNEQPVEFRRLMACIAYLPEAKLRTSPYADLTSPALHEDLEPLFVKEYCASLGMSRQDPLRVVGDIGGGGALARIEKGRKVMRERKSEWSQTDELPIEIPLPPENRYHSIFACPVSKEQSTERNPPMMMPCGHVLNKDSLHKLSKPPGVGRVKCPYCPAESSLSSALRVYF